MRGERCAEQNIRCFLIDEDEHRPLDVVGTVDRDHSDEQLFTKTLRRKPDKPSKEHVS